MTGRLGRMGYIIRLILTGILYGLGVLFMALGRNGDSLNPLALIFLFLGSGVLLLAFLAWWFATVRRLHDMNLSGWWFLLVCFLPVLMLVLCVWPGYRGYNRFGMPMPY